MKKVDSFEGWDDGVEGRDAPASANVIQGMKMKFTNTAAWVNYDEQELPAGLKLVVVNLGRFVQRWKDGKPEETITIEPGQKFPDLNELNAKIPESEWEQGPDGKPRGPWQSQHVVYMLDPISMERYCFPTGTVGGSIAIRELVGKLKWMRLNHGSNVYAVITLADTPMKTRFGTRPRPHFQIAEWTKLGGGEPNGDLPSLPAPAATLVPAVSIEDDMNDELPDDLAPPKPAVAKIKAVKKAD